MVADQNKTILIIDDDREIAGTLQMVLQNAGYRVQLAQNGVEGQRAIEGLKPDLVLTDMMMPVLDGAGAIRVLLKMRHDLPVIAVSGLDAQAKIPEMQAHTNIHFLQKPYAAAQLLQTLKTALSKNTKTS